MESCFSSICGRANPTACGPTRRGWAPSAHPRRERCACGRRCVTRATPPSRSSASAERRAPCEEVASTSLPGVGFSIEPGVYLPGELGVRSEVNAFVGERGVTITPEQYQRELLVL